MPAFPALALVAVLAAVGAPMTPAESMYPADEIKTALPARAWCSEWSQFTFKADGTMEMKDISDVSVGGPTEKPGDKVVGKWSMQGAKVHVEPSGDPAPAVVDLVALRDRNVGMVLGFAQEYWAPCE